MTCTFFGHKDTPAHIENFLCGVLLDLIENHNANNFLIGNQGCFDSMALRCLDNLKLDYPHINYSVVLAYLPETKPSYSCDTIYPEGLELVPYRYAIDRRNHWMIDNSDCVITYVCRSFGGAYKFKNIAIKHNKTVIELSEI